jgi:hypothetical protein
MTQKVKLHCKIVEFGNIVTIKENGCQIKKRIRKNMKHIIVRLVYHLPTVL